MRLLRLISVVCICAMPALANYDGPVDSGISSWFKNVRSPHGVPCCDIADGHRTTWRGDPLTGGYEVPIEGVWTAVPPESVIENARNPTGDAIVWYVRQDPKTLYIRCFVPASGA